MFCSLAAARSAGRLSTQLNTKNTGHHHHDVGAQQDVAALLLGVGAVAAALLSTAKER